MEVETSWKLAHYLFRPRLGPDSREFMMKLWLHASLALLLAILMTSCRSRPEIFVYNNVGEPISIVANDKRISLEPNESRSFPIPWDSMKFEIETESDTFVYDITYPPKGYIGRKGKEELFFQVEKEGSIFVLKDSQEYPLSDFEGQPNGYPLRPSRIIPIPSE